MLLVDVIWRIIRSPGSTSLMAVSSPRLPIGPELTELDLPPGSGPGQQIKILLVHHSKKTEDWFLVNSQVNIPTDSNSAEVILMRRSTFRQIAAEARDAPGAKALQSNERPTTEDPKRALIAAAARRGLTAEQLPSRAAAAHCALQRA